MKFNFKKKNIITKMVHIISTAITLLCSSLFQDFVTKYNKVYKDENERNLRMEIFCDNYNFVANHNSQNDVNFFLDINEYADLTDIEFKSFTSHPINMELYEPNIWGYDDTVYTKQVPSHFDWRDEGHVSVVKNQGQCGSCWTFSTTGAIEAQVSIHNNKKVLLSEQELVDCSWIYANMGCSGGMVDRAFRYAKRFGLSTEDAYPYTAQNHMCKYKSLKDSTNKTFIQKWLDVVPLNETRLTETLYNVGPISVAIDASSKEFRFYKSGVFDKCGYSLDHAVLLVGFGTEDGQDFYTIKNSWGTTYGDEGYIKISRGVSSFGTCGVAMMPSFPVV